MICPLCHSTRVTPLRPARDGRPYGRCDECDLYALDPAARLDVSAERARYDLHEYAADDAGYFRFVAPLLARLTLRRAPGTRGLDFGCGRVPVLAQHLIALGYDVATFDSIYRPDANVFEGTYDFVIACEVIEHLYDPAFEFTRLRRVLTPGAPLFIMTDVRRDEVDFATWSYRRDPTHVGFYSARTFRWIAAAFGFNVVEITDRVITLVTPGG